MADVFDAQTANTMGLLHRLVAPEQLEAEVQAIADKLLSRAPLSRRYSKCLLNRPLETELERAFYNERETIMQTFGTHDALEAMTAFREKRPAVFEGR